MTKRSLILFLAWLIFSVPTPSLWAYWVWSPETGKFVNPDAAVQDTPQEQFDYAMGFYKKQDLKEAAEQLRRLLKKYPGARIAAEAQFQVGVIYEELQDYGWAFRAYRNLLERYPQSERLMEAIEREFRIGNLFLSGRRGKLLGLEILPSAPRAAEVFKHLVEAAPFSAYGDRAQFHLGLAYKKTGQYEEAVQAFQGVIDNYPQSRLVPQARFQIADTAYLESASSSRDQLAIDRAAKELNRFLEHYPDSSVSDKAARLRQEIDEKNAEKNYRIALFYEKENFLDSAFVYYRDVSTRYPHTQGGQKAKERLARLEKPAEFLKSQEADVETEKENLLREIQTVEPTDPQRKEELEQKLKRLEKSEKDIEKSKSETLKRRRAALRQKETELREKDKALQKKRKQFAKNLSEDLTEAFQRWQASLERERAGLVRERMQIEEWEKSLGVRTAPLFAELVPFGRGPLSPVEEVRRVQAKRLGVLARSKRNLWREKENLYREYEKLITRSGLEEKQEAGIQTAQRALDRLAEEILKIEKHLDTEEAAYRRHYGKGAWETVLTMPVTLARHSAAWLNPFEKDPRKEWETKSVEELSVLGARWREKATVQKKLVETISEAFDHELARIEEKRLAAKVTEKEEDLAAFRREIKQLERQIRGHYNEIQDRNARKNRLLEELEELLKQKKEKEPLLLRGTRLAAAPVRGFYLFWRSFLFGLPERDVRLTQEAGRMAPGAWNREKIQELREEIELESLLIGAGNQERQVLARQLDALRARASFSGAPGFRSLLIKFPYVFIREAIASANRLIPKESRQERLVEQLNRETSKLEQYKRELDQIERLLAAQGVVETPETLARPGEQFPLTLSPEEAAPDQNTLQEKIRSLRMELALKKKNYEAEWKHFEEKRWDEWKEVRGKARAEEVEALEKDLIKLIEKEQKVHEEEAQLLAKRKKAVESFLEKLPSDLFTKELQLEKEEIESRLNEIQKRQTLLGEELRRFRPQGFPPT